MKIFISYCSQDAAYAQVVAQQLTELHHEVMLPQPASGLLTSWADVLQSIEWCSLFILIVSQRVLESEARRLEYTFANDIHKRILCVVVEPEVAGALPAILTAIPPLQLVDAAGLWSLLPQAIQYLPPALAPPPVLVPYPNLIAAQAPLYLQAAHPPPEPAAQVRLVHNLADLLERRETSNQAHAALEHLHAFPELTPKARDAVVSTLMVQGVRQQRPLVRRILSCIVLLVLGVLVAALAAFGYYNRETLLPQLFAASAPVAASPTAAASATVAATPIPSATAVSTPTVALVLSPTATFSATPSATSTATFTATATPTATLTATATPTATLTATATPSATPTASPSATMTLTFTITPSPTASSTPSATVRPTFSPLAYVGIEVEDTPAGVRVIELNDTTLAAGLQIGDQIEGIDFATISTRAQFIQAISARAPNSSINLRVRRGSQVLFIPVTLGAFDFAPSSTPAS